MNQDEIDRLPATKLDVARLVPLPSVGLNVNFGCLSFFEGVQY
jgi:hypothetical protein